ncbi:MAG: diguanylate cyclase [Chloroflexi bacterium]|nr:diguanylate cyclase [Chloroflexota bacterium]
MDLPLLDLPPSVELLVGVVVLLFLGAIAGTAGFAATAWRRQIRLMTDLTASLATGADPTDLNAIARIRDEHLRASFEQLAQRVSQTWTLATRDLLTQVANRQTLLTRLDEEIERATRYGHQLSIALIDLDHFKRVNDSYGHAAGDLLLRALAQSIEGSVRRIDLVGRYGGEEFMVILPETDVDTAASIAEKIRRQAGREQIVLDDGTVISATLSAGVAGGLGAHLRLDAVVHDADAALYSAKSLGRDQVYVFHEVEDDRRVRRAAIAPAARERAMQVGREAMSAATLALATVLNARPGWAGGPSTMIAESAAAVAESMGLPAGEIERIRTASLLHDLGKLAIPDEILAKPTQLNESEWRVVTEHPKIGQVVLEQAGALRDAATIVLHHHEWYDGRGYPHGLSGQQIPIGARIVAVADAYEAMVSGRPYRSAISHERALAELRRHAGLQFDPEIVEQFATIFAESMPWEPSADHGHDHPHPHPHRHDDEEVDNGLLHDELHARRRGFDATGATGTNG